ncbi:methyltransferase [Olivibacter sp. SDN3]|uniref:tRNA1(Val) (adenine(37)-N6)-methyltransferase n=1 Tax=Olivibacter sp. SDN3 TaxID=2764720 RepID=UPI001651271B|nr:methyltransferase [Olivibacter sp. SDN3]QNL48873.1 methyltransferase [Olivibacter sp. SDN3]
MSSPFRFKEFSVEQEGATMKINTDGVLLGALAYHKAPKRILDIGTGTGVIALMMAQRFEQAVVDALEVDKIAFLLARDNFADSRFSRRLNAHQTAFETFSTSFCYDLIVSNPPFFMNALKSPDIRKSNARHASFRFYEDLLSRSHTWLAPNGFLQLVLPPALASYVVESANTLFAFNQVSSIRLKSFVHSECFREILFLSKNEEASTCSDFVIYKEKGVYSEEYIELLRPFFLNF